MSVIRRPGFGRRTRRRVVDFRAALSVAVVDAATVGCWFTLVVIEPRRPFTALAGLTVLFFGALVRTNLISETLGGDSAGDQPRPRRIVAATVYATIWLGWLIAAESVGAASGLLFGTLVLVGGLVSYFVIQWFFVLRVSPYTALPMNAVPHLRTVIVPATLLGLGATVLLGIVWFGSATLISATIPLGDRALLFEIHVVVAGILVLGCCSFLGTHRYLSAIPDW